MYSSKPSHYFTLYYCIPFSNLRFLTSCRLIRQQLPEKTICLWFFCFFYHSLVKVFNNVKKITQLIVIKERLCNVFVVLYREYSLRAIWLHYWQVITAKSESTLFFPKPHVYVGILHKHAVDIDMSSCLNPLWYSMIFKCKHFQNSWPGSGRVTV